MQKSKAIQSTINAQKLLFEGCQEVNYDTVLRALDNNANPNQYNDIGKLPIVVVCGKESVNENDIYRIVELLISRGADVNKTSRYNNTGNTVLHVSASYNYTKVVKLLLEKGANKEVRESSMGDTPLIRASRFPGNSEVIQLLIQSGADINARQQGGRLTSPVGSNLSPYHPGDNLTALHCAILEGIIDNIKVLLHFGAKKDLTTSNNKSVYNLLDIPLRTNKITQATFDTISKILRSEKVEFDLKNQINSSGDFSLDNPFRNIIGMSNQNDQIISLLKSGKLNDQQIKLGFKSAAPEGIEVIRLFESYVPKDMLITELQSRINILRTSISSLESNRDMYISQSEQTFDLMHGDMGDRAQALTDYSNFMAMGGKEGYLNRAIEVESRIKEVEYNISQYQDYSHKLNNKDIHSLQVALLISNNRSPIFAPSKTSTDHKNIVLESLLQKANVVPRDREMIEIKFADCKLAQQFTEELNRQAIPNLGTIILLSASDYNVLTGDKEASTKLESKTPKP